MSTSHFESMLFDYETTTRTDYRDGEIKPLVKTEYQGKQKRPRVSYEPVKYVCTMTKWRDPLPFNVTIKRKDILQTNPHVVQETYTEPPDLQQEEVRRTRPRLVMTPAVSLDEVSPGPREILVNAMYTSEMTARTKEAITPNCNVRSPLPGFAAPANSISLPKYKPPYVSKDWRKESVTWDGKQLRSFVAPTREFWLMPENEPKCTVCKQTAERKGYA